MLEFDVKEQIWCTDCGVEGTVLVWEGEKDLSVVPCECVVFGESKFMKDEFVFGLGKMLRSEYWALVEKAGGK